MRPLRLELDGFGSFRSSTTIDFDDAELFVLSGPTGAGKSTVIDGITFALYGTIARLADRRLVEAVISRGRVEAKVRCTFTSEGRTFAATRVVRRTRAGGATTKEARLTERVGDAEVVLAGSVGELDEAVVGILGLSFEHFTRCVVLPQGAFQAFLHARGNERQELLASLLHLGIYKELATRANDEARLAATAETVARNQLEGRLAEATPERLAAAAQRAAALATLRGALEAAEDDYDAINAAGQSARAHAEATAATLARLDGLRAPSDLDATAALLASVDDDVTTATKALLAATESVERARAEVADHVRPEQLAAWRRVVARHREQAAAAQQLARTVQDATAATAAAAAAAAAADTRLVAAEAALATAEVDARAAALATQLSVGAPCPVCRQDVAALPDHDDAHVLDAAREEVRVARHARTAAVDAAGAADRALAAATARHDAAVAAAAASARELTEGDLPSDDAALDALATEAAHRADVLARAEQERVAAARQVDAAERAVTEAATRRRAAWDALAAARDTVAALEPPRPGDGESLPSAWHALLTWRDRVRPAVAAEAAEALAAQERERERYRALLAEHRRAAAALGVDPGGGTQRPLVAVATAHGRAADAVQRLEDDLEEATRLRAQAEAQRTEAGILRALGRELDARHFQQWLLNRALARVVDGATRILRDLSGGAYSLAVADDNSFEVVDHANADDRRSVRTLSGGETFLASLALALALSDHVVDMAAEGAARLETLFIDEGFGTLDAETLQVVASALHELSARGRTVGLVTHVEELARLVPTRFEVRKVGNTSEVERREVGE